MPFEKATEDNVPRLAKGNRVMVDDTLHDHPQQHAYVVVRTSRDDPQSVWLAPVASPTKVTLVLDSTEFAKRNLTIVRRQW